MTFPTKISKCWYSAGRGQRSFSVCSDWTLPWSTNPEEKTATFHSQLTYKVLVKSDTQGEMVEEGWKTFPLNSFQTWLKTHHAFFSVQLLCRILVMVNFGNAFTQPDKMQTSVLPSLWNIQQEIINGVSSPVTFITKKSRSKIKTSGGEGEPGKKLVQN